jgi:molecular chaperone IbpA
MATLDLTPLLRSGVGFDRIPDLLWSAMTRPNESYPPYNVEKLGDDTYRIVMAVAGFGGDDIEIVAEQNQLVVRGQKKDPNGIDYLHRGITNGAFTRHFQLADFVEVKEATMGDGLLVIELKREVPEALKPRTIPINAGKIVQLGPKRVGEAAATPHAA